LVVAPEVERIIRERLETFDEDAKAARPWEDVLADLKRPARCPHRHVDHPVHLSALAARDIPQPREWPMRGNRASATNSCSA
jgi:hypothetical protein